MLTFAAKYNPIVKDMPKVCSQIFGPSTELYPKNDHCKVKLCWSWLKLVEQFLGRVLYFGQIFCYISTNHWLRLNLESEILVCKWTQQIVVDWNNLCCVLFNFSLQCSWKVIWHLRSCKYFTFYRNLYYFIYFFIFVALIEIHKILIASIEIKLFAISEMSTYFYWALYMEYLAFLSSL